MRTELLPVNAATLEWAASFLRAGEVVAFPTETVYGLGADALNEAAVARIFEAKGRPADNPLIAHIADVEMLETLVTRISTRTQAVIDAFWPGPLTLVLEKTDAVPDIVSAGLPTVAVRMPSHRAASRLIRETGRPIAAPSANRSGKPSPTTAQHVLADLQGRIPLILDGGPCGLGVESTVLDMTGDTPTLLRPGGVTMEMLREVLPGVHVDEAVLGPLAEGATPRSPGMKHRHYAPEARMTLVRGEDAAVIEKICSLYDAAVQEGKHAAILCSAAHAPAYGERKTRVLGEDTRDMAAGLFDALRMLDEEKTDRIFAEATDTDGMGLALMNRMLRAADFDVVDA